MVLFHELSDLSAPRFDHRVSLDLEIGVVLLQGSRNLSKRKQTSRLQKFEFIVIFGQLASCKGKLNQNPDRNRHM